MAPVTQWNPSTKVSRGNIAIGITPVVLNLNAPKVSEMTTGTGLNCSVQTFNGTSSANVETLDWLCNPTSEQIPGSTTHTIDDLVIKTTGQADATLVTSLAIGDVVYLWRRDGMAHDSVAAAGQFVWVWKVVVTSIDPLEANNVFIGITAKITVIDRSKTAVAIVT